MVSNSLSTFRVVSGVKLKQFLRVVGETVDVDPVFQNDDYPGNKIKQKVTFLCLSLLYKLLRSVHIPTETELLVVKV